MTRVMLILGILLIALGAMTPKWQAWSDISPTVNRHSDTLFERDSINVASIVLPVGVGIAFLVCGLFALKKKHQSIWESTAAVPACLAGLLMFLLSVERLTSAPLAQNLVALNMFFCSVFCLCYVGRIIHGLSQASDQ